MRKLTVHSSQEKGSEDGARRLLRRDQYVLILEEALTIFSRRKLVGRRDGVAPHCAYVYLSGARDPQGLWNWNIERGLGTDAFTAAAREDTGPRRGEPGYLDSMPDRSARTFPGAPMGRAENPLPDVPPFTAFVGNLTFEVQDDEVRDFFAELKPISVRLVKDSEGKAKGFGYVEFGSRDDLKNALDLTGQNLGGRTVRINVAEAPSRPGREYTPSAADEASQWRRTAPLAPREPPAPRRTFSGASHDDRDWGAARGAKFTPSRESSGYGRPRGEREHHHEPTAADEANQWRSAKPLVAATEGARGPRGGRDTPPHRPAGPADTESTWSRGTRVATPPAPAEPQRPRLNLLARSEKAEGGASGASSTSSGASPFGAARPVDTLAREREAEERLAARQAAAHKQREDAEKAKQAAKERREREHQEARERRPVRVHPSRLPPKEPKEAKEDEDGFEAVPAKGTRAAPAHQNNNDDSAPKSSGLKKENKGFSFAAAAGALDDELAEDTDKLHV